ncbi:hypothetical protein ZWY2020_005675 [Hordeum vulgare]|nr:hypothetical protein ZWY2020_005675 [Hordeum vulgare]
MASYYDATGAFRNLSLASREPMQVWVDYDAAATEITVALAPARSPRPRRPLLTTRIDLTTVVADTAYVGFSSGSSIVLCKHYVLGWSFSLDGAAPALDHAKLPTLPRIGPKPQSKTLAIALPIVTTAAVLAAVGVGLLLRRRLRYAELREGWERLLGAGGFGSVYRGVLPGSRAEVAVKRVSHESRQGMREFIAEVVSIGRLRHRNLVQLLGYCRRRGAVTDHACGGHHGYLAPELVRTGKATTLSDVFAFGAFLLEVACGRRPIEIEEGKEDVDGFVLADWVLGHWRNGAITRAVDAKLGTGYDAGEADTVLRLGLTCLHPSPAALRA